MNSDQFRRKNGEQVKVSFKQNMVLLLINEPDFIQKAEVRPNSLAGCKK